MPLLRYLTHPQVRIDPAVPVPQWGLSEIGAARAGLLARSGRLAGTSRIVSSTEVKAVETAEIVAAALGLAVEQRQAMHENDRSATGFLPPPEFEQVADLFFAHPNESIRGWERAVDAQARILRETEAVLATAAAAGGDTLLVGHGGVGTLLLLHYLGEPIARLRDQPPGGGNIFAFDLTGRGVLHGWRSIEDLIAA